VATPAVRSLALELDEIFATVARALGSSPDALQLAMERRASLVGSAIQEPAGTPRIPVGVRPSTGACPARGAVSGDPPSFIIYVTERTTIEQLRGVAAHELGHLFSLLVFDGGLHGTLGEGFATWAAGRYWTDWQGVSSLSGAVRRYRAAGTYQPLGPVSAFTVDATDGSPEARDAACLARRDLVYTLWAGFVEYLVAVHGLPKVIDFMRYDRPLGRDGPIPPLDYAAAFGRRRDELERDWLRMIDENVEPPLAER
jgi:hypothetical protein